MLKNGIGGDFFKFSIANTKKDAIAGFVVSLMALPLSLGIAIASGFPPIAGVLTAIIGGIVVSFFSGSTLAIKGPAGGLSAIMLSAVVVLGDGNQANGYALALAAVVFSGFFLMFFGLIRMGSLADFFPTSTIHGMLAALGIIMALKQIHIAVGVNPLAKTPLDLFLEIPNSFRSYNPKIALIGGISLLILVIFSYQKQKIFKAIPAPLIVLLIVVPLGQLLEISTVHDYVFGNVKYHNDPLQFLVNIPSDIRSGFAFPNFSQLNTLQFWEFVIMLSFACAIESLISTKAIDKIDPQKRISNQNRDLFSIGLGNVISGFFGGLPMISESKRSVINVMNDGKTKKSNFFHGVFLLAMLIVAVPLISLIPMAALAAMLIYTGARMASPQEFSKSYKTGAEQFLVFIVTFIITVATNFMLGIAIGIVTELIIHLRFGVHISSLFKSNLQINKNEGNNYEIVFNGPAIFSNYLGVRPLIEQIPQASHISFDFSKATVVDHTFMEHLAAYEETRRVKGGDVSIIGLDYHKHLSDHPLAAKRILKNVQITPRQRSLEQIATNHNYIFDPRMINNNAKFRHFSLAAGSVIKLEENIMRYQYLGYTLEISDVLVENGGQNVITQDYKMTVMYISNLINMLPDFTLQKEGFIDTLFAFSGFNDIDFSEYPNFSYYYLLKGPNELEIRSFFKAEIIHFLEQNKGYHIESKKKTLLIYKRPTLMNIYEIEALDQFSQKFIKILQQKFGYIE